MLKPNIGKRLTTSIANTNLLEGQILMASHGTQSDMKIGIPWQEEKEHDPILSLGSPNCAKLPLYENCVVQPKNVF